MKRIPIVAGNWKMHKTIAEARALVDGLKPGVAGLTGVEVWSARRTRRWLLFARPLRAARLPWAPRCLLKEKGAYTSQVAPSMLVDAGCRYVIIGHSENRGRFGVPEPEMTEALHRWFGETDESVNKKTKAALAAGLIPIVCVGETLDERRAGKTDEVIAGQVERGLAGLTGEQVGGMVIAYEPVWAIGTGETCDTPEANRWWHDSRRCRARLRRRCRAGGAHSVRRQREAREREGALLAGAYRWRSGGRCRARGRELRSDRARSNLLSRLAGEKTPRVSSSARSVADTAEGRHRASESGARIIRRSEHTPPGV